MEACLLQRGGGYFDPQGHCIMDNETAVQAMHWYVPLVAGQHPIGKDIGGVSSQFLTQAVENGYLLCMLCPDWRCKLIEEDMPRLKGKMALMDLHPRSASVHAVDACRAIEIRPGDLYELYERDCAQFALIQMNMGREICRRLRAADDLMFAIDAGRAAR